MDLLRSSRAGLSRRRDGEMLRLLIFQSKTKRLNVATKSSFGEGTRHRSFLFSVFSFQFPDALSFSFFFYFTSLPLIMVMVMVIFILNSYHSTSQHFTFFQWLMNDLRGFPTTNLISYHILFSLPSHCSEKGLFGLIKLTLYNESCNPKKIDHLSFWYPTPSPRTTAHDESKGPFHPWHMEPWEHHLISMEPWWKKGKRAMFFLMKLMFSLPLANMLCCDQAGAWRLIAIKYCWRKDGAGKEREVNEWFQRMGK